jgi:hypothetical protein
VLLTAAIILFSGKRVTNPAGKSGACGGPAGGSEAGDLAELPAVESRQDGGEVFFYRYIQPSARCPFGQKS